MPGKVRSRIRGLGAVLLLAVAACGGTTTQPAPPPPPPGPPPPPPPPPPAPSPMFSKPIAGEPNQEVWYGAYRDHGNQDYQCGFKWSAGHGGVDILLKNFEVQDSGVGVLAAAPGAVIFVQDGLFDRSTLNGSGGFGNYVILDHGPMGPISYYGHMRSGSIRVAQNDIVARGDTLGLVGSSGNSNWPHLHFEVNSLGSVIIDPFLGPCNRPVDQPTWLDQLPWQGEFAVMDAGITNTSPSFPELLEKPPAVETITRADAMVTLWVNLHNIQAASARTALYDPAGAVIGQVGTGVVTTFSVRFVTVSFGVAGVLQTAGPHEIAFFVRPLTGGGEREVARRTFRYDPAVVPGPREPGVREAVRLPRVWIGPEAGDRGPPRS